MTPFAAQRVSGVDGSTSVDHRAAMNPHHYWKRSGRGGGPPDVEGQAILGLCDRIGLHGGRPERLCLAHALPGPDGLRNAPAKIANWRCGIGNALPTNDAIHGQAANGPAFDLDDRSSFCDSWVTATVAVESRSP